MKQTRKTMVPIWLALALMLLSACNAAPADGALQASGLVEADEFNIAPELSGRVVEVLVDESDSVSADDPLFVLDGALLQAERNASEAALASSQANVRTAQTALDSARFALQLTIDAALQSDQARRLEAWDQDQANEFDQPIWYFSRAEEFTSIQAEVETARQALEDAETRLADVEKQEGSSRFMETETRLLQARAAFEIAQDVLDRTNGVADGDKLRDSAQEAFDDAEEELNDAQQAYDEVLTTEGAQEVLEARAGLAVARERLDTTLDAVRGMKTGINAPEITTARNAVDQAEAAFESAQSTVSQAQAQLDLLDIQIAKLTVQAPIDGVVLTRAIQPGEVIQAGAPALTIANLDNLTVTVFISENRYGEVSLGDQAELSVDSFPNEVFEGTVTRIADQAEFTPRNVQTQEERQTTVYAVELSVDNPENKLKPGMPVDVLFGP